jgi:CheY-like chemotaxis protein
MLQRILLIDDSDDDAFLLKKAFQNAGFNEPIFHVADADAACDYLDGEGQFADRNRHPLPDVILLDLKMPKVDGLEMLKWIRSRPHLGRAIVIVVTGVEETKLIKLAYQLGAHSYLSKDAEPGEVENLIRFLREYARIASKLPKESRANGHADAA